MADGPRAPRSGDDPDDDSGRETLTGFATWQKALAIVGLLVLLVLGVLLIGGDHGPGRHAPATGTGPSTGVEVVHGHDTPRDPP